MTKTKFEQEQALFAYLSTKQRPSNYEEECITMIDLMTKLHIGKSDLLDIMKPYKKTSSNPLGLINVTKVGKIKCYSLEITDYDQLHEHIKQYIDGINNMININIKKINKEKPLFKDVKETKKPYSSGSIELAKKYGLPWKTPSGEILQSTTLSSKNPNKNATEILDNICLLLSDIFQKSFLITYYKTLNQIPPNKIKQADDDQKLCIKAYSNIIKKLRNVVGRRALHQKALENYLFTYQMILRRIDLKS
jgi:phage-related tail protein